MKKGNILIAVIAVMAAASVAKAAQVDFDGRQKERSFSPDAIERTVEFPEPVAIPVSGFMNEKAELIDLQLFKAIKHCDNDSRAHAVRDELVKLLVLGTDSEKQRYEGTKDYRLPGRLVNMQKVEFEETANKALGNCVKWETKRVCRDKEVWQTACALGTFVCYVTAGGTCGPAGVTCSLINSIVSECVDVPYCVEWDAEAIPGFGNPGAGL